MYFADPVGFSTRIVWLLGDALFVWEEVESGIADLGKVRGLGFSGWMFDDESVNDVGGFR